VQHEGAQRKGKGRLPACRQASQRPKGAILTVMLGVFENMTKTSLHEGGSMVALAKDALDNG